MQQDRSSAPRRPGGAPPAQDGAVRRFKDEIGKCRFVDDPVMKLCSDLGRELAQGVSGVQRDNSLTQVRKFFNQVRVLQGQARAADDFSAVRPGLRVLQAQVAYAVARRNLSLDFKKCFDAASEKILASENGNRELEDFVKFFEAMYAYFYFTQKAPSGGGRSEL
jgi:CRISPR type III-A-associated protein Csm2